ncbi:DNA-binding domain-containing protein [Loktanella sp. SALINAS62]|uniref:HvfC/BufC N-terminal domain-containing protein n=1 Tax=Loktanella sp. SALINAS62 TaxID=2706124 RepID=UPI001B8C0B5E|nr:DNA-binding domain-containing protein [Loktanella sp. SALINAS62]MBS1302933.1 DUF2063 domain-containing protein [Loktanella sp. SALINAS62]
MPGHLETQTAFRAALNSRDLPPGITAVGDLDRRFSVYRNTVAHTLSDALAQRFPAVQRIVGKAFFRQTARIFVADNPPRSPVLQDYGTEFPAFLADFPPAASLPYLADVALIEMARGQAYHAADAEPLSPAAVMSRIGAAPDTAQVTLHPSVRMVSSPHAAVSIWRMNQPGAAATPPPPGPETALIFRRDDASVVLPIPPDIARTVTQMQSGTPLGALGHVADADTVGTAFSTLLQNRLIVGLCHI